VLAERHQRRVLVVHLHAQRAVGSLAHLGNRVKRRLVEVLGRHDRHPRHQHRFGLTLRPDLHLFVVPIHHIADAAEAELLELADDLLCGYLGPLGPNAHDFRNASGHLNHRRHLAGR